MATVPQRGTFGWSAVPYTDQSRRQVSAVGQVAESVSDEQSSDLLESDFQRSRSRGRASSDSLDGGLQLLTEAGSPSHMTLGDLSTETAAPRVSVIVPCYKTAQFVAETLQSVFAQTYRDFEVVLVNDGSPDTPELEKAIAPWRDRITYLHTENCGLAGARNNGIRAARGELIALLDSDDSWEPNYLEVQVAKLDADPSADIVYPRLVFVGDGVESEVSSEPHQGEVTFTTLVEQSNSVVVSVLARKSALERAGLFDASLRSCEDFDMWLRCVKHGSRIIHHNEVLLRYRVRPDSLSSDPVWMYDHAERVLLKMRTAVSMTDEERKVLESSIRRFRGNRLFHEGRRAFIDGDMRKAVDLLEQSNDCLSSVRIRLILMAIRTAPRTMRFIYRLRLHQKISFAWSARHDVA